MLKAPYVSPICSVKVCNTKYICMFFYLRQSRTSVYASWLWIVIREISEKLQEKFRVPNSVVAVGHPAGGANMALTKLRRYVSA